MKTVNNIIEKVKENFLHQEVTIAEFDKFMMKLLKNFDGNFELISIADGAIKDHIFKGNYCWSDFNVYFDNIEYTFEDPLKAVISVYAIEWDTTLI